MPKDLRDAIRTLDETGELLRIEREVDPRVNLAAVAWAANDRLNKATHFDRLSGYEGWRAISFLCGSRQRIATALQMPVKGFIARALDRLGQGLVRCEKVGGGPVKEVIWKGLDIDLARLPIHVHSDVDPGPYIGNICIAKDPETGIRNVSMHRFQVKGERKLGVAASRGRHFDLIYQKHQRRGEAMPIAIVIGVHPALCVAACWTTSFGVDELEIAGALLGEPVPLVECETVDLEVPANAEIVIEGEVPPDVLETEGPFGEHAGLANPASPHQIVNVKAVTMRASPIYYALQGGRPISESQVLDAVPMEMALFQRLKDVTGYIDLRDVVIAAYAGGGHIVVVQMVPRVEGQVRSVLMAALSSQYNHPKVAIAVDEDVDPHDPKEVFWSMSTRVSPQHDVLVIPGTYGIQIDNALPFMPPDDGSWRPRIGSKMLIDATRPPTRNASMRSQFERVSPRGLGEIDLDEFLGSIAREGK